MTKTLCQYPLLIGEVLRRNAQRKTRRHQLRKRFAWLFTIQHSAFNTQHSSLWTSNKK